MNRRINMHHLPVFVGGDAEHDMAVRDEGQVDAFFVTTVKRRGVHLVTVGQAVNVHHCVVGVFNADFNIPVIFDFTGS